MNPVVVDVAEQKRSLFAAMPQEAARILGESINFSRQGQVALWVGKVSASPAPARKTPVAMAL